MYEKNDACGYEPSLTTVCIAVPRRTHGIKGRASTIYHTTHETESVATVTVSSFKIPSNKLAGRSNYLKLDGKIAT